MRALLSLPVIATLVSVMPPVRAAAPDGIDLTASHGPSPTTVTLHWTGSIPTYSVFRSADPARVTDSGNRITQTSANSYVDSPPSAGRVFFYAIVGDCPVGEYPCNGFCRADTDGDAYCDDGDNCPSVPNPEQANLDGDSAGDACDFCITDPGKADRGRCGCFHPENVGDDDGDGVINCHDQCPGSDDAVDADRGGLPDACDPCPTGLCGIALPERFYAELPGHQAVRVSRDGRWIAAIEVGTYRGVLIPTEQLIANPTDTSYYEPMGNERIVEIRGFSDDNNVVLANVETTVPQSTSSVWAAATYDRTHGNWTVLGLYDERIDINACRLYPQGGDISSDGKAVFGRTATVERSCRLDGFRYDVGTDEWQLFAGPEGEVRLVEGASGDGGRIVGSEDRSIETAVIWTYQPPDLYSSQWMADGGAAYDVSFDGSVASVSSGCLAHRWTAAGGLERLGSGTLDADQCSKAVAISDGGNIVAGYHVRMLASGLPFIWVQGVGFGDLRSYLMYRGFSAAELGNLSDSFIPYDVSSSGRVIVGRNGRDISGLPGWVVITRHE